MHIPKANSKESYLEAIGFFKEVTAWEPITADYK